VELNPQIVNLVKREYAIHIAEARGFVAGSKADYDLIQVALLDSFGASSAGLYALSENDLYTVEALEQFLAHLKPGGLVQCHIVPPNPIQCRRVDIAARIHLINI